MASPVKAVDLNLTPAETSDPTKEKAGSTFSERAEEILHKIFEGHEEYLGVTPD